MRTAKFEKPLTIALSTSIYDLIKRIADERNVSMGEIAREALEQGMKNLLSDRSRTGGREATKMDDSPYVDSWDSGYPDPGDDSPFSHINDRLLEEKKAAEEATEVHE